MILTDALHYCEIAEYESAINLVGWPPDLSSQDGERLLIWGICASQKGVAEQTKGVQELAKDCLTRAMELLLGENHEMAKIHLALCYYRLGEPDNSLLLLKENFLSPKPQFCAQLTLAIIAVEGGDPEKSLQLLDGCRRLCTHVSEVAQGKFHNHRALALALLSSTERNDEYRDRAIIEFEAAIFHWADAPRLQGIALNNLARLYSLANNPSAAFSCVDRAISLTRYDKCLNAQCIDQKARILIDQGRHSDALVEIRKALSLVADGEQQSVKDECLETLNRCTKPGALLSLPKGYQNMTDSRLHELTDELMVHTDWENAATLIELLARLDRARTGSLLRRLIVHTDEFEEFFQSYLKRFDAVEQESERVS